MSAAARIRSRTVSRSTTRQATADTTKTCRKASSSPIRDSVKEKPSSASSRPASRPRSVDPVSRRARRVRTTTATAPATAEGNRQPKEEYPNSCSPPAISHLPRGGWTMKEYPRLYSKPQVNSSLACGG
jgi:hypothetical protein